MPDNNKLHDRFQNRAAYRGSGWRLFFMDSHWPAGPFDAHQIMEEIWRTDCLESCLLDSFAAVFELCEVKLMPQ